MNKPIRVQRKRTKGFKLPPNTVCVTRGTRWGNPFKISDTMSREESLSRFRQLVSTDEWKDVIRKELKDKNLACYCPLHLPCHVDIYLEIANS